MKEFLKVFINDLKEEGFDGLHFVYAVVIVAVFVGLMGLAGWMDTLV